MPEQQNIEFKQSWHDDYLKWVYGFANALGDRITNKEYQELNNTSERTASRELTGLIEKAILRNSEVKGAGSFYFLHNQITPE